MRTARSDSPSIADLFPRPPSQERREEGSDEDDASEQRAGLGLVSGAGSGRRHRVLSRGGDAVETVRRGIDRFRRDRDEGTSHREAVYPETLVLGEGNAMANVFVHVKNGLPKSNYPVPAEPVVIDQKGCKYSPHVVGVMVGQEVKILNPDGTLHNVHALCKVNTEFNLAMPKFRAETSKVFEKEEFMFPMKCDVHPWMGAWVSVMSHPFFQTTANDGKFTLANLPAGTYEVEAWHEKLGKQSVSVTLGAEETKEANFTFAKPSK